MSNARIYTDKKGRKYASCYGVKDSYTGKVYRPRKAIPLGASEEEIATICSYVERLAKSSKSIDGEASVSGLFRFYFEIIKMNGYSSQTLNTYRYLFRRFIDPYIGKMKYEDLEQEDLYDLYRHIRKKGGLEGKEISQRTIKLLHSMIQGCFSTLKKEKKILHNVASDMKVSIGKIEDSVALDEQSLKKLKKHLLKSITFNAKKDIYPIAIWLILHTGIRRSEASAITFSSFNYINNTLKIDKRLSEISNGILEYSKPKSKNSKRVIAIDDLTSKILCDYCERIKGYLNTENIDWYDNTPLFNSFGKPINPDRFYRYFKKVVKELNLPKGTSLHTLRHTHATFLIENGSSARVVMERLGHHNISITLGIYGHLLPASDAEAARSFADI